MGNCDLEHEKNKKEVKKMWDIQYNQSTCRFELTQDGLVILELEAKELDQIGMAVTKPLYTSTRGTVKIVKTVVIQTGY